MGTLSRLRRFPVLGQLLVGAGIAASACAHPEPSTTAGDDSLTAADLPVWVPAPVAGTFDQQIDHPVAPGAAIGTFKQRYWYSPGFASGPESPVIFYFCGEAECSGDYAYSMGDTAKTLGAAVVVLEHRYYGESLPFPDLTLEHMRYLTIHNALEDAAAFQAFARDQLHLAGKWNSVGGSYPGMLAAFYREKHPELVVGAWASSAPVRVQKSFWGYDAVTSRTLGPECSLLFRQALAAAETAYDDPAQRPAVSTALFGGDWPAGDKAGFLNQVSGFAMEAAQFGKTHPLCAALEQHPTSPLDGLMGYVSPPLVPDDPSPDAGSDAGPALEADAGPAPPLDGGVVPPAAKAPAQPTMIPRLTPPTATGDFANAQWFYQVCTEVGFYQVHNPDRANSVLSELIDDAYYDTSCEAFVHAHPNIDGTLAEYYAPIAAGTVSNLFFVNGSFNPWSALSITDPSALRSGGSFAMVVQQGSHGDDLANLKAGALLGVFEAHVKFHDLAKTWLAQ